jgi:hypothetical protein
MKKSPGPPTPGDAVPDTASPPAPPEEGSFGRFAEKNRGRWAKNHPNMGVVRGPNGSPSAPLPLVVDQPARATGDDTTRGTRLVKDDD